MKLVLRNVALAAHLRQRRLLGQTKEGTRDCRQGPHFQTCQTCYAPVGEPCRFNEARRAMLDALPAGGE